jgi:hypothetical protein
MKIDRQMVLQTVGGEIISTSVSIPSLRHGLDSDYEVFKKAWIAAEAIDNENLSMPSVHFHQMPGEGFAPYYYNTKIDRCWFPPQYLLEAKVYKESVTLEPQDIFVGIVRSVKTLMYATDIDDKEKITDVHITYQGSSLTESCQCKDMELLKGMLNFDPNKHKALLGIYSALVLFMDEQNGIEFQAIPQLSVQERNKRRFNKAVL